MDDFLDDVYFGNIKAEEVDWRENEYDPGGDDDEELAETPSDVVGILGFDPKEFSEEKPMKGNSKIEILNLESGSKKEDIVKEIRDKWPVSGRQVFAIGAFNLYEYDSDYKIVMRDVDKNLVAVAALDDSDKERIGLDILATREIGYGREMMEEIISFAAVNNKGIRFFSTVSAGPFYRKIGMKEADGYFEFSAKECKEWVASLNKKKIGDITSEEEPISGVFVVGE